MAVSADISFVEADKLGMQFSSGLTALNGISFKIPAGQFVSLVGPSGCGKSTLLRIVAGLLKPTHGSLLLGGNPPDTRGQNSARLGFVFQEPTLLPWRTARANVALPLELHSTRRADRWEHAGAALERVGLGDFRGHFPHQLSGGMRMRCSLARALVTQPNLLLLDEPFGALDDISRQQLNDDLNHLWLDKKWTALFVTHNIAEAAFLSQRILVMSPRPGQIIAEFEVPFAPHREPGLRAEPDFARFTGVVSAALRRAGR